MGSKSKPNAKWIKQRRMELASCCSDAEKAAYNNLVKLGYSPIKQFPIWTGRKIYFADLYIPKWRLIVEIDGGYHLMQSQRRKDKNRSSGLWRLGYHVARLSNHDARDIEKVKSKILNVITKFTQTQNKQQQTV